MPRISYRAKMYTVLGASVVTIVLMLVAGKMALEEVNYFFEHNYLAFHKIVQVEFHAPITARKREVVSPLVAGTTSYTGYILEDDNRDIAEYICEKFGKDCPIALAVARAESGMRTDAYNFNTNDTLDYGIMQINSVHWGKEGCSLEELVDPYKNVDCAYKIWEVSGWTAWSAVNNGSYLAFMK